MASHIFAEKAETNLFHTTQPTDARSNHDLPHIARFPLVSDTALLFAQTACYRQLIFQMNRLSADDRADDGDILDLIGIDGIWVIGQDDKVGQFSRRDRTLGLFFE